MTNLPAHLKKLKEDNGKNTAEKPEKGTYLCPEVPQRTLNIYNHLLKEGLLQKMQRLTFEEELTPDVLAYLEKKVLPLAHS